ncbi:hypothetical protein A2686_03860 [Candidatus Woesebacteria bacterium RIFCSPHIGHO2_01_FULL_38_10]|uniref:DNA helicase UvrD n=1 Tax=Candidatus Woesebacteria bacterium RIFCSPLOWO2_01_FULL_39_10b TaxID=1802517 RepID=A0A1F8B7H4_9BACT|nr:MAG: hypothetical protein A2686_03860 [Candidatus Woesebacteria bacterium RIFCSPHIGHO2_01_FULL_38_10]OGM59983.1 MAG: hypothetical protein A2892_03740 [Candidatus Woesebacteria bacterium RIFCSPLOWO2_01_FULL_39_10b]
MKVITDLHLHSKYSRAVSASMTLANISRWAEKKGIDIVGTGDFTQPMWFKEIESQLYEVSDGIYKLKESDDKTLFLLTTELSCIYSHNSKGRRIHFLVFFPKISDVKRFNSTLLQRGINLFSDGRPILGMSLIEVSKIALETNDKAIVIPAHAWTPWYGFYGSMSGYESLKEAFNDLEKNIPAIETGLSSDPAMNWRMDELKEKQIVSFGDAHSLQKLGREATVFELSGVSYENVRYALNQSLVFNRQKTGKLQSENKQKRSDNRIAYTIEFYPEEGKYHYTGHRDCKVSYSPNEARKKGVICPICGRKMTIGVMSRVEALAKSDIEVDSTLDRYKVRWIKQKMGRRPPFVMLVPLLEIIAESYGLGISAKKVEEFYETLISNSGSEFKILLETDLDDLKGVADFKVIEGIKKVRMGDIIIKPGYDGVFGTVKIWKEGKELKVGLNQESLF